MLYVAAPHTWNRRSWRLVCRLVASNADVKETPSLAAVRRMEKWVNRDEMVGRQSFDSRARRMRELIQRESDGDAGRMNEEQRIAVGNVSRLSRQWRWQEAFHILAGVTNPHPVLYAAVIDACAKSMEIRMARTLYRNMPKKTVPACNVMITLLGRFQLVHEAELVRSDMAREGLKPTVITFASLIDTYGMVHDVASVFRMIEEMRAARLTITDVVYGRAITACAKAGDLQSAETLLESMEMASFQPQLSHLTSLIVACTKNKDSDAGEAAFSSLCARSFKPDVVVYTALMGCFSGNDGRPRVEALLADMQKNRVEPDGFTFAHVLRVLVEAGDVEACRVIKAEITQNDHLKNNAVQIQLRRLTKLEAKTSAQNRDTASELERETEVASTGWVRHDVQANSERSAAWTSGLPPGWQGALDPASDRIYYWKEADPSRTTTWQRPVVVKTCP